MIVFLSHSRQNSGVALRLSQALANLKIDPWLDIEKLAGNLDWDQEVAKAVRKADAFVFLIGPSGPSDRWQHYEWQQVISGNYAQDASIPLVPIVIGEAELPGFLGTRHPITLSNPKIDFTQLAQQVGQALKNPKGTVDKTKIKQNLKAREMFFQTLGEEVNTKILDEAERAAKRTVK